MNDVDAYNLVLLVVRVAIGVSFALHGINKVRNGIAGTAGWFESLGMRAPVVQAWSAAGSEIGGGLALAVGLLTPLGGAAMIGTMVVALVIAHRSNGFFVFNPGGGWEYVFVLAFVGLLLGTVGPGEWSLDHAFGLIDLPWWGSDGLYLSAGLGLAGAALVLGTCYRPEAKPAGE